MSKYQVPGCGQLHVDSKKRRQGSMQLMHWATGSGLAGEAFTCTERGHGGCFYLDSFPGPRVACLRLF